MGACQKLEGTRLPTQCPCVDGGQFIYKGKQYSYCEKTNWCATEVDEQGKFIGKFAKCKKKNVKNACHALHELTTTEGKDALFSTYTKSPTGCPCWFDMTRSDCACCEDAGVQQIIGRYRPLVILATSTLLAQTAPGVLQVVLNVETEETKVLILLVGQDVGTQMILVTAILYQETACTFRNVIVKQNVS